MPKRKDINKVLVIGSGPIIIGQAAEFDYAGTQACKALKEEGIEVVLVNSNPATIMTDLDIADIVYIEPLDVRFLEKIIAKERPQGLLPTLGGQTGLNLAVELANAGILKKYNVELLGTPLRTIQQAEDREYFKELMTQIGEPTLPSVIVTTPKEAYEYIDKVGLPLIVRPAYTLGGTGGGIIYTEDDVEPLIRSGVTRSMIGQVLLEKCVLGWKEIEYEVMRDKNDNCIIVCSMENFDPMGVHTGDSIVVAPTQTLSDKEYQMLRSASLKIIRALGIEGGCNVQFALSPHSFQYYVIEVNPRVSRSSALASKATGYPIARCAAKIAIGLTLDEITNKVTGKTTALFEPAIDYIVVKIPRWPFDKFKTATREIGTQMKATGEVMAIGRTFEEALLKAIRSLEIDTETPFLNQATFWSQAQLEKHLKYASDHRLFALFEALRRGMTITEITDLSNIDKWFINKMNNIIELEQRLMKEGLKDELLIKAKRMGFSDKYIAEILKEKEENIKNRRSEINLKPVYKMVDTCAAEFEAETPYYYSTYEQENEAKPDPVKKAIVIGSGPIRIGQGIEFDYCNVHCVNTLSKEGYQSIIINNNPETVSTDFDTSDKLYFEPLTLEDVLNVINNEEKLEGVVVQLGGQTPLNLASGLYKNKVKLFGTPFSGIDIAEDRRRMDTLLKELNILKPEGAAVTSFDEAKEVAKKIGYPVLIRPSYVLGGRAMEIVFTEDELSLYMKLAVEVNPQYPVLVDKYISGIECEIDVLCDKTGNILIPAIMQHIERAGVHSGDSMAVAPANYLSDKVKQQIVTTAEQLAKALKVVGLMNIQYVIKDEKVYVLEVNPRASRTVPYISKVVGLPCVKLATKLIFGSTLKELNLPCGLYKSLSCIGIKAPVFSFSKLSDVDIELGPEMKSTGEIMGINNDYSIALYKALLSVGLDIPKIGGIIITVADKDKEEIVPIAQGFAELGYKLYATSGTYKFLKSKGITTVILVKKLKEGSPNCIDLIKSKKVVLLINTPSSDKIAEKDAAKIRRTSVEYNIPCLTSIDTASALLHILQLKKEKIPDCYSLNEYLTQYPLRYAIT